MSDANFRELFPSQSGFSVVLVDTSTPIRIAFADCFSDELGDYSVNVQTTASCWQAICRCCKIRICLLSRCWAALGLMLGTIGLAVAWFGPSSSVRLNWPCWRQSDFQTSARLWLMLAENTYLLLTGLLLGMACVFDRRAAGDYLPRREIDFFVGSDGGSLYFVDRSVFVDRRGVGRRSARHAGGFTSGVIGGVLSNPGLHSEACHLLPARSFDFDGVPSALRMTPSEKEIMILPVTQLTIRRLFMRMMTGILAAALMVGVQRRLRAPEEWPHWRGPDGTGISTEKIADSWPEAGPKQLWSQDVGIGFSSPIALDGKIYLFTQKDKTDILSGLRCRWREGALVAIVRSRSR